MTTNVELPAWAEVVGENRYGATVVKVDADAAIESVLAEYRDLYSENAVGAPPNHGEFMGEPTCYALEVAYQTAKMDVIAALGWGLEIHMKSAEKPYAHAKHPDGAGALACYDGIGRVNQVKKHYTWLRGFWPGDRQ